MSMTRVPSAIGIVEVTDGSDSERSFVVTNEATGRHFSANEAVVRFIEALRRLGSVPEAAHAAELSSEQAGVLIDQLAKQGIAADGSGRGQVAAPATPIEGKLISVRADLLNAGGLARRLSWLGQLLFSAPAAIVWTTAVLYAIAVFASNGDKVAASLQRLGELQTGNTIAFLVLFVALKAVHELGHILAYRIMCLREGLDPGPIRVGLMVFAATPFPFTDVTGAWRIRSRWRRAIIGAAGIYFETFTVAILTLAWVRLDLGALEPIILQVAVLSSVLTLMFNLNPAVKLDGYYILTDLIRQPNLAGRSSQAARTWVGRSLGADLPKPKRHELAYWLLSYVYRWSIFAGVFWIAYRFDPRLATVVAAVCVLLLIVRPLIATFRPIMSRVSPLRFVVFSMLVTGTIALAFVPFKARLLTAGQMFQYRTEFIRPPEVARLLGDGSADSPLSFEQPQVSQDRLALVTRASILNNLSRAIGLTATEGAALATDRLAIDERMSEIDERMARLAPAFPQNTVLTPMAAETFVGSWVRTDLASPLAAVSSPTPAYLTLRLPQNRLEADLSNHMLVRLVHDPDCGFRATLVGTWQSAIAREGLLEIEAAPTGKVPPCAASIRNGAAIVAHVPLPPRSIVERVVARGLRLLQDRLPFEKET